MAARGLTEIDPLAKLKGAVGDLGTAVEAMVRDDVDRSPKLVAFLLGVTEVVLVDLQGNFDLLDRWFGDEWESALRSQVQVAGKEMGAAAAVAHSVRVQLGWTEESDRQAAQDAARVAQAATGTVLAWSPLHRTLKQDVVLRLLEVVAPAGKHLELLARCQVGVLGNDGPGSPAANLEVCVATLARLRRTLSAADDATPSEVWRIVGSDVRDVTADKIARGVDAGLLLLAAVATEIEARGTSGVSESVPAVTVVVDECAELLEYTAFRRELFALAGRPRSERAGFTVLCESRAAVSSRDSDATVSAKQAARVNAFKDACASVAAQVPGVWRTVEDRVGTGSASLLRGLGLDRAAGTYVLGEVELTAWAVRRALVRLQLACGVNWDVARRRSVYEATWRAGELWRVVSKVHAALGVTADAGPANVASPAVGVARAASALASHPWLVSREERGVLEALREAVLSMGELVEAAHALIGEGAAGEGVWSLDVAGALAAELGCALDRVAVTDTVVSDWAKACSAIDVVWPVEHLASLGGGTDALVPAGCELATLTAAARALSAVELVLSARDEGSTVGLATSSLAARLQLAEALVAVDLTELTGAASAGEEADVLALRSMRALGVAGPSGSAVHYGHTLQYGRADELLEELAVLGHAVMAIARAVDEAARLLGERCAPSVVEPLAAAAAMVRSAGEELLQDGGR